MELTNIEKTLISDLSITVNELEIAEMGIVRMKKSIEREFGHVQILRDKIQHIEKCLVLKNRNKIMVHTCGLAPY